MRWIVRVGVDGKNGDEGQRRTGQEIHRILHCRVFFSRAPPDADEDVLRDHRYLDEHEENEKIHGQEDAEHPADKDKSVDEELLDRVSRRQVTKTPANRMMEVKRTSGRLRPSAPKSRWMPRLSTQVMRSTNCMPPTPRSYRIMAASVRPRERMEARSAMERITPRRPPARTGEERRRRTGKG